MRSGDDAAARPGWTCLPRRSGSHRPGGVSSGSRRLLPPPLLTAVLLAHNFLRTADACAVVATDAVLPTMLINWTGMHHVYYMESDSQQTYEARPTELDSAVLIKCLLLKTLKMRLAHTPPVGDRCAEAFCTAATN